jgi:hypothetical protein
MRAELVSYMHSIVTDTAKDGTIDPSGQSAIQASQLKIMMEMYERIQEYIFRLMATDSVPKVSAFLRAPADKVVLQDRARELTLLSGILTRSTPPSCGR